MSKLFVDEIQPKTTGGIIKIPSQVAFLAKKVGGGNATGIIDFETTVINIGNGYSNSTYKFTAPVAGLYQLQTFCLSTNNADANSLQIMINNVRYAQGRIDVGSSAHNTISIFTIANLSVGDLVHVELAGGAITASTSDFNNFSGFLIGASA